MPGATVTAATVTAATARAATIPAALGDQSSSVGLQGLLRDMGSQGKAPASGWARAETASRLSQLPHFQFKEITKSRKRWQERLGPGKYNIRDFLQETRPCSLRGICDTRERRFRDSHRDCVPGPGTYGPGGNPYTPVEERDKRSAGTRGLMDSGTAKCVLPAAMGSGLGPGTYHLKSSIDAGLQRAHSPGQTFLGDRRKPAGGGHRALERRTKPSTSTVKSFLDELMLRENKKKGCFSTMPRNPGCPTERIFWATLSQCPKEKYAVGPGSYDPKPMEGSVYSNQPPFWTSAKRFDRKSYRLFTGNENRVGVGRYDVTKHEKYPQKMRYQSLYQCDVQRYLSDLQRDAYLLERLKPVAKNNWSDLISAPRCPDTSEELTTVFQT